MRRTEAHYAVRIPWELAVQIFGSEERLRHGISRTRASNWRKDGVPAGHVIHPLLDDYKRSGKKSMGQQAALEINNRRDRRSQQCERCIKLIKFLAERGEWAKVTTVKNLLELLAKEK